MTCSSDGIVSNCERCEIQEEVEKCLSCESHYHLVDPISTSETITSQQEPGKFKYCESNRINCQKYDIGSQKCLICNQHYSISRSETDGKLICTHKTQPISRLFYIFGFLLFSTVFLGMGIWVVCKSEEFWDWIENYKNKKKKSTKEDKNASKMAESTIPFKLSKAPSYRRQGSITRRMMEKSSLNKMSKNKMKFSPVPQLNFNNRNSTSNIAEIKLPSLKAEDVKRLFSRQESPKQRERASSEGIKNKLFFTGYA